MSTDIEWEKWGRQDPYFGVITWDMFRAGNLDAPALAAFFESGQMHVDYVLHSCRRYFDPAFSPRRVLDFGCGVGRLLIPFAAASEQVVGVDVSPSMLAEAQRNCEARAIGNVVLAGSDDELTEVEGEFDLVHSAIVLQHIQVPRGRVIFRRLLQLMAPGGVAALHLTFGKAYHPETFGQPPAAEPSPASAVGPLGRFLRKAATAGAELANPDGDPVMLMNAYNLSEIAFLLQMAGIAQFHSEFTDHGGELGVFLFFRRPAAAT
ncbi:MAG: class I SAM-dependent methyltransferase [Rubrivivax sp.]|nr:class I SAM-dependent methyltransferase [Rubrivivax sp.]